jgi:hypothetical protein
MLSRPLSLCRSAALGGRVSVFAVSVLPVRADVARHQSRKGGDDADDLAREQRLREAFQRQGQQGASGTGFFGQLRQAHNQALEFARQQSGIRAAAQQSQQVTSASGDSGSSGSSGSSGGGSDQQAQQQQMPANAGLLRASQSFFTIMVYFTAFYAVVVVWQLSNDQSIASLAQGVPHWGAAANDVATYIVFRNIYSFAEQRRISGEFEAVLPLAPGAVFGDFLGQRYGATLQGATASLAETTALAAAALRADFGRHTKTIRNAASSARGEPRVKVEAIANALRAAGVRPAATYVPAPAAPLMPYYGGAMAGTSGAPGYFAGFPSQQGGAPAPQGYLPPQVYEQLQQLHQQQLAMRVQQTGGYSQPQVAAAYTIVGGVPTPISAPAPIAAPASPPVSETPIASA